MIRVYNSEMEYIKDTSNYFNLIITNDLSKGYKSLQFDIKYDNEILYYREENKLEYDNYYYVIKLIETKNDYAHVTAMPYYGDLNNITAESIVAANVNIDNILSMLLANSEWNYSIITPVYGAYSFEFDNMTIYSALQQIKKAYNIEIWYSTKDKKIIIGNYNNDKYHLIINTNNLIECEYKGTTNNIITKLYPIGANNVNIASVNNGVPYIENYTYTSEKIVGYYLNTNLSDPNELMNIASHILEKASKPQRNYKIKAIYDAKYHLGDCVRVVDNIRGIDVQLNIIKIITLSEHPGEIILELGTPESTYNDVITSYIEQNNSINQYVLKQIALLTQKMEESTS